MDKPGVKRYKIGKNGESAIIDRYNSILVLFKWFTTHDLDFGAYYEAAGNRRGFLYCNDEGDLKAFPKILYGDAGVHGYPEPYSVEQLRIDRDGEIERIRLMCFSFDYFSGDDPIPFHEIDMMVEIYVYDKIGAIYEIVPAFTGTGNCACLATIENIGETGVKIINEDRTGSFDFKSIKSMDEVMDFTRDF